MHPVRVTLAGLILAMLLGMAGRAQAQSEGDVWGAPLNLSRSGAAAQPRIVAAPDGTLQVFWWDQFDGLMTAISDNETWSSPMMAPIVDESGTTEAPAGIPVIVGDGNGWVHALWLEEPDEETGVQSLMHSHMPIGSTSWSEPQTVAESAVAFEAVRTPSGTLALAYLRTLHTESFPAGVYVRQNPGGGGTWGAASVVHDTIYFRALTAHEAYVRVADDGNQTIHVVWEDPRLEQALYARSVDGGTTWTEPTPLGDPDQRPARPRVLTLPDGGALRLWEASAGKQVYLLRGHVGAVGTLAFSLDGKLLATGGADGSARLWTVADGKPAAILPEHAGAVTTLAFRPDGKALATGDEAGVRLWELPAGKLLRVLAGGAAAALAYSPDGKFLASTGADGTTRVWSATDGEELVRLIATDGLGSLVVTPQNHYASWRAGHEAVALRVGDRALALEPFALKLARRDLVLERLGLVANDDLAVKRWVYRQRLQEMRFSEDVLRQGFRVPRLALRSNGLPARTKQRRLKLKVRASDGEFRLDRLCVAINQVPVLGANGIDLRPRQRKLVDVALNLELTPGANRIEMSVFNEKGVESPRVSLAVECTAPKRRPKLWLVAIGVSRFKEAAYDLTCAAADANAIAGLPELDSAKSPFESVFDQVEVLGLADSLASRRDIRQAREFLEKAGVDDVAIVFAAGHSLFDEQQDYYYASHDIDFDQLPKWGLKFTELDRLLDGIPARRKLLLLDVSVPGTLPADAEPGEPVRLFQDGSGLDLPEGAIVSSRAFGATPMELRLARAFQSELLAGPGFGSGAAVIAACGAAEYRVEHGDAKSGVLAQALLECLTQLKGDTNKDGLLRVAELRNYLAKRVPQLTKGGQVVAARVNPASDFAVAGK